MHWSGDVCFFLLFLSKVIRCDMIHDIFCKFFFDSIFLKISIICCCKIFDTLNFLHCHILCETVLIFCDDIIFFAFYSFHQNFTIISFFDYTTFLSKIFFCDVKLNFVFIFTNFCDFKREFLINFENFENRYLTYLFFEWK